MKHSKRAYLLVIAAVAGMPFLAKPALGQMRVDTSGHATDANNQIGSGGYNSPNPNQPLWTQYQNALLTNNDAGGFGFRGHTFNGVNLGVGYTDPFAFRGLLAGQGVDQFISISTGVPTMANPTASSGTYAAPPSPSGLYYGTSNHSVAPPGTDANPNGSGYVPPIPVEQSPSDTRQGTVDFSGSSQIIPKPYEMILPGPVDPTANAATQAQQMLAANPLFGTLNFKMMPQMQQNASSSIFGQTPLQQGIMPQVAQGLTQQQLLDLQQQVNNATANGTGNPTNSGGSGPNALSGVRPGGVGSASGQGLPPLMVNSSGGQLTQSSLSPEGGNYSVGQSTRQYPTDLPPAGKQSTQYAQMQKSIQDYNSAHSMTDEQANRRFQQILKLRDQAAAAAENGSNVIGSPGAGQGGAQTPGANQSGILPGGIPAPDQPASFPKEENHELQPGFKTVPHNMGGAPGTEVPPPVAPEVPVDNFSKGVPAKGLADLIASGDVDVQHGNYDKAIASYNKAIDVVPNNPLILVARSIAEMGGGYYAQANSDLHLAISGDPAVLMGQYDLTKELGEARLKSLIGELKGISTSSGSDTMHSFLLTFCYYNSHHAGQAAEWLQTTDQRSSGQDPAIIQMKKYWNFNDEIPLPAIPGPASGVKGQSSGPATRPAGK